MKLLFEYDIENKAVHFFGDGFRISDKAETYEDIAEFAKDVIEHDIAIPNLKHRMSNVEQIYYLFQDCDCKHWFRDNADMLQPQRALFSNADGRAFIRRTNNG